MYKILSFIHFGNNDRNKKMQYLVFRSLQHFLYVYVVVYVCLMQGEFIHKTLGFVAVLNSSPNRMAQQERSLLFPHNSNSVEEEIKIPLHEVGHPGAPCDNKALRTLRCAFLFWIEDSFSKQLHFSRQVGEGKRIFRGKKWLRFLRKLTQSSEWCFFTSPLIQTWQHSQT